MFHAQSLLLDFLPLPLPCGAPSLLYSSHQGTHCDPHFGGQSGRVAEQHTLTETGGRWSEESVEVFWFFCHAKAREAPLHMRFQWP